MDPQLVQRSRYVLKARVRQALRCPLTLFSSSCKQLLDWIDGHPILRSVVHQLGPAATPFSANVDRILGALRVANVSSVDGGFRVATTTVEHAALCLAVVRGVAAPGVPDRQMAFFIRLMNEMLTSDETEEVDKALEAVRDVAVQGLFEYLDEQIDSRNALIGILEKYRQRCEWFRRTRLREIARGGLEGKQPGERSLAIDLREYIFNQGVEFTIEPVSASGEVDLLLREPSGRYIVIDAKYIKPGAKPSELKDTLIAGFHQVARYCDDHQEPAGHLIVFLDDMRTPRLPLSETDGFRFITVKGKHVYYFPIHIFDGPTASKSGTASEIDIKLEELVELVAGT